MSEIKGFVAESIEKEFMRLAMRKFGYGKGSLSKALEKALCYWIKLPENE